MRERSIKLTPCHHAWQRQNALVLPQKYLLNDSISEVNIADTFKKHLKGKNGICQIVSVGELQDFQHVIQYLKTGEV
jgi:hypothetical protein